MELEDAVDHLTDIYAYLILRYEEDEVDEDWLLAIERVMEEL